MSVRVCECVYFIESHPISVAWQKTVSGQIKSFKNPVGIKSYPQMELEACQMLPFFHGDIIVITQPK